MSETDEESETIVHKSIQTKKENGKIIVHEEEETRKKTKIEEKDKGD